jgi:hypothetical protein
MHQHTDSGSATLLSRPHTRQASAETGTVTLLSCPSTPALSERSGSLVFEDEEERGFRFGPGSPETPAGDLKGFEGIGMRKEMGVDVREFVSPVSPVGVAF